MKMNKAEKMDLRSLDVAAEKRDELKRSLGESFPEIFAEGAIDFEQLKRVLGEWIDPGKERFGLNWPGKAECMKIIQQPSVATLKPIREESVNFDETENLFIEGDNLEVLKLLQKAYFGKVKMIYIDPPYNTGNEFIYPDKYAETLETYLAYTGQADEGGRKFATNADTSGRYHSRWLSMMYPRLYLARNLMKPDGTIFISIDDNEAANLKLLCDGIFGEENFIAQMIWEGAFKNDARQIGVNHEYVVVYAKDRSQLAASWAVRKEAAEPVLREIERLKALHGENYEAASEDLAGWFRANKAKPFYAHRRFRYIDKYGAYKEDDPTAPGGRKFDLINPRTKQVIPLRKGRGWTFDQETFNSLVDAGKMSFVSPTSIMVRRYFHETDNVTPQSVFYQPARSASERLGLHPVPMT
jgi:adenine-specific DNA-methyltransferase